MVRSQYSYIFQIKLVLPQKIYTGANFNVLCLKKKTFESTTYIFLRLLTKIYKNNFSINLTKLLE